MGDIGVGRNVAASVSKWTNVSSLRGGTERGHPLAHARGYNKILLLVPSCVLPSSTPF